MALEAGSRLGPYEVLSRLGAGGMGEVWRARDPRLGRDVAIKMLPDAVADDPERLARFEREARLLASLQHANIAVLHGLEESAGRRFLVMQCIEGESLAQRLERGAVPVAETVEIGIAIAAALETAHENGVVHRDLKPGNVMVTPAGDVKVLDFGLAKGSEGAIGGGSEPGLSASPTRTYAKTNAGVILGTAAYMSPEQARGRAVDRRTDIWSFGCVLFELLTGRQAFAGETVSDIVAQILQSEPEWALLPPATPPRLRALIERCLRKDARRRLRDVGDARLELEEIRDGKGEPPAPMTAATATTARPAWPWLAGLVLATAAGALAMRFTTHAPHGVTTRFRLEPPAHMTLPQDGVFAQVSPDGRSIAMVVADSSGTAHVALRPLDSTEARVLPGTDRATFVFWSPDSRWIGFASAGARLMRVSVAGGTPELICEVKSARGASWGRDGTILVAPYALGAVYRVPASGGELTAVVQPDSAKGETGLRFPCFLPDGKHFLYSSMPGDSTGSSGRICVASLEGGKPRVLLHSESGAIYANPGWIVTTRDNAIVAYRFDAGSLTVKGDPLVIGDRPCFTNFSGAPRVSASNEGTLAYVPYRPTDNALQWRGLDGRLLQEVPLARTDLWTVRLSPDENRALLTIADDNLQLSVAVADLARGVLTPVTEPRESASFQVWAPDGRRFAYMSDVGIQQFVVRSFDDESRRHLGGNDIAFKRLDAWTSDGWLVYERLDAHSRWDIWRMREDGSAAEALIHTPGDDEAPVVSPDGRWLAFHSDVSGSPEVFVAPFGRPGPMVQVSTGGGVVPVWSAEGRQLIFDVPARGDVLMAVDIGPGETPSFGAPRPVGTVARYESASIARDGKRLLALVPRDGNRTVPGVVIQHWEGAVRAR